MKRLRYTLILSMLCLLAGCRGVWKHSYLDSPAGSDKSSGVAMYATFYLILFVSTVGFLATFRSIVRFTNGSEWPKWVMILTLIPLGIYFGGATPGLTLPERMAMFFSPLGCFIILSIATNGKWKGEIQAMKNEDQRAAIKEAYGVKGWATQNDLVRRLQTAHVGIHIGNGYHWNEKGHMLCVGGAGQGKGTCIILPALLSDGLVNAGISVVVLDPKGENAAVAAPHLKAAGYDVHVINPFNIRAIAHLGNSRFNPFDLIEPQEVKKICDVLAYSLHNRTSTGGNEFFDSRCRQYISLYMRYALHIGKGNFDHVYRILRYSGEKREELLASMASDESFNGASDAEAILGRVLSPAIKTEESIYSVIEDATDILGDDALRLSMSASDFDLRTVAEKPTAIFICVKHDELRYYAAWVRMFTDLLLKTLTTYYNPSRKVLVLLDEFAQLGYLNEFKNSPAVLRGYNVTLWPIVQELGQLQSIYKDAWETFVSNSVVKHWFGGSMDNTTAEYISKRMPTDIKFVSSNADGSPREKEKRLLEPNELMRFDGIIAEINQLPSPMMVKKTPYWSLPFAAKNASKNPFY